MLAFVGVLVVWVWLMDPIDGKRRLVAVCVLLFQTVGWGPYYYFCPLQIIFVPFLSVVGPFQNITKRQHSPTFFVS